MTSTSTARRERHPVGVIATFALTYRVFLTQIVSRSRLIALGLLGALVLVVGWAVGVSDTTATTADALDAAVGISVNLGLTVLVPVVALVFAAGVLGDSREDGTLVYLWLRPLRRWPIAVGAYASAVTVIAPLTIVPVVASAALIDSSSDLVVSTLMATSVAVAGYSGLFLLLGTLLRKSIVWGLAYIIVWEGIASGLGKGAARLSIRGYAGSVLGDRTGVVIDSFDVSQSIGVIVPVVVAVVAIALTAIRLDRVDVA